MKKRISLLLVIVMLVSVLYGCNLIVRNYERDYKRVVATIKPYNDYKFYVDKQIYDDFGPTGNTQKKEYVYTSDEVSIYKSQLNNYVYSQINDKLNAGKSVDDAIDEILTEIVNFELLLIEADRLFFAGELYWTKDDIDEIQRSVYSVIDYELFTIRNTLLTKKGKEAIAESTDDTSSTETTYPVQTQEEEEIKARPEYYYNNGNGFVWSYDEPVKPTYQWHDEWYTSSDIEWYVQDQSKYSASYPGMLGDAEQVSLEKEALSRYIADITARAETIIGITDQQLRTIKEQLKEINKVKDEFGVEYTYPLLGKTLLLKLLVGNTYIKNAKAQKLQEYVEGDVSVSYSEVDGEYKRQLENQKEFYADVANYDAAIKDGKLVLNTPSDRYLFVKHILLPFSEEQKAALEAEKKRLGTDEDAIEAYRARLATEITAREHLNGEDNLSVPARTSAQIFSEVKATMKRFENDPKYAERTFDELIYKYNTDPGIFDNRYGYAVVYKLNEGESETYMTEFAEGARDFRDSNFSVGQVLDYYVVTDYGIHIMYYAADPKPNETKYLNSPTTAGAYETVYENIEATLLASKKTDVYSLYTANYIAAADKKETLTYVDKIISDYKKEMNKAIYG